MAVSTVPPSELTVEQVEDMLARAAQRLREKPALTVAKSESFHIPKLDTSKLDLVPAPVGANKFASVGLKRIDDPLQITKLKHEKKATSGPGWFDMPRTDLTPELKRDLQLIKMRSVLDPHRQYKKDNGKMQAPEFSQVGTIVEGATEYYSGRIDNKQRKRTLVEEVLAGEHETKRFKRQYGELQSKTTSGKKAFYKALKAQRQGGVKKGSAG